MTVSVKTKFLFAGFTSALALSFGASSAMAQEISTDTHTVTANVSGFDVQKGVLLAALVDAEGYKGGKPIAAQKIAVTGDAVTLTFKNLPSGEYAIRMFHDIDSDGVMKRNMFGIPSEPYAFSNNAKGKRGPAPWSKAKFIVSDDVVQTISF